MGINRPAWRRFPRRADWSPKAGIIHALFPTQRGLLSSVQAILDFLAKENAVVSG
jgi:hypothetical protein